MGTRYISKGAGNRIDDSLSMLLSSSGRVVVGSERRLLEVL